jgi:hypothetical protein
LPHLEDKDTQEKLENQRKFRRSVRESRMTRDLNDQAQGLVNSIRVIFQTIYAIQRRLRRGNICRYNLSATGRLCKCGILSKVIDYFISIPRANSTGDIREVVPLIINEQFLRSCVDPPVPAYAYVYNEGKPTNNFIHPHTIIALEICEEPNERLTRLEVLAIVAVTVTRLSDNLPKRCKTVPIMVISAFGKMKA